MNISKNNNIKEKKIQSVFYKSHPQNSQFLKQIKDDDFTIFKTNPIDRNYKRLYTKFENINNNSTLSNSKEYENIIRILHSYQYLIKNDNKYYYCYEQSEKILFKYYCNEHSEKLSNVKLLIYENNILYVNNFITFLTDVFPVWFILQFIGPVPINVIYAMKNKPFTLELTHMSVFASYINGDLSFIGEFYRNLVRYWQHVNFSNNKGIFYSYNIDEYTEYFPYANTLNAIIPTESNVFNYRYNYVIHEKLINVTYNCLNMLFVNSLTFRGYDLCTKESKLNYEALYWAIIAISPYSNFKCLTHIEYFERNKYPTHISYIKFKEYFDKYNFSYPACRLLFVYMLGYLKFSLLKLTDGIIFLLNFNLKSSIKPKITNFRNTQIFYTGSEYSSARKEIIQFINVFLPSFNNKEMYVEFCNKKIADNPSIWEKNCDIYFYGIQIPDTLKLFYLSYNKNKGVNASGHKLYDMFYNVENV